MCKKCVTKWYNINEKDKCGVDIIPMLKLKDMTEKLGVTVKTLQKWDNQGILKAYQTPTNRRYYTEEQYSQYIGKPLRG